MSEVQRRWRRRHPRKAYASSMRWQAENPEKRLAHTEVKNALRRGDIARPDSCELCGESPPRGADGRSLIVAHHDDYSAPLDIRWLCRLCHAAEHLAEGEEQAA